MPSIAHLVLGGVFGICFYYMSDGKFTKTHVFIFFINNYLGPDIGWALGIGYYTHHLLTWSLFAFVLTIFYYYFTRFTIEIDGIKHIEIVDLEKYKLTYLSTYCLVLAGGILHIYLDDTMNNAGVFYIIPQFGSYEGIVWTFKDFIGFMRGGILEINPIISVSIGIVFILGFIFIFTWFIKNNSIKSGVVAFLYIIGFMIYFYLVGGISTGEHGDAGAIIYISLFWLPAIILCTLSTRDHKLIKRVRPLKKSEKNLGVIISKIVYLIVGVLIVLGGVGLLIGKEEIIATLLEREIIDAVYSEQISNTIIVISIAIMGIGGLVIALWLSIRKIEAHHKNLLIISIWLFLIGLVGLVLAITGILLNEVLVSIIFSIYGIVVESYVTFEEGVLIVIILGTLILVLTIINFILAIGLTVKNRFAWKFSIYYHLIFAYTIVGLTIACALSENSVKELLNKE